MVLYVFFVIYKRTIKINMNDIGIVRVRNLTQSDSGRGVARNLPKEAPLFIFVSNFLFPFSLFLTFYGMT